MKPSSRRWRNTYGRNFGSCVMASHVDASSARKHGHPTFFLPLLRRNSAEGELGAGTPLTIALPIKQHSSDTGEQTHTHTHKHSGGPRNVGRFLDLPGGVRGLFCFLPQRSAGVPAHCSLSVIARHLTEVRSLFLKSLPSPAQPWLSVGPRFVEIGCA